MCVTLLYFSSSGEMVRKSAFTGSVFVQCALASMVCSVLKRFLSRSNAYSCACRQTSRARSQEPCAHLPLSLHERTQVRCLVAWSCRGIDNHAPLLRRRGQNEWREARGLVLHDDLPLAIPRVINELSIRWEQQQVWQMLVSREAFPRDSTKLSMHRRSRRLQECARITERVGGFVPPANKGRYGVLGGPPYSVYSNVPRYPR